MYSSSLNEYSSPLQEFRAYSFCSAPVFRSRMSPESLNKLYVASLRGIPNGVNRKVLGLSKTNILEKNEQHGPFESNFREKVLTSVKILLIEWKKCTSDELNCPSFFSRRKDKKKKKRKKRKRKRKKEKNFEIFAGLFLLEIFVIQTRICISFLFFSLSNFWKINFEKKKKIIVFLQ